MVDINTNIYLLKHEIKQTKKYQQTVIIPFVGKRFIVNIKGLDFMLKMSVSCSDLYM